VVSINLWSEKECSFETFQFLTASSRLPDTMVRSSDCLAIFCDKDGGITPVA